MEKMLDIIELIAFEKGLQIEKVYGAIKDSIIKTAQNSLNQNASYDVEIDKKAKILKHIQNIQVCESGDERLEDPINYISIENAKKLDSSIEIGDELRYEIDLEKVSRTVINNLYVELEYQVNKLLEDGLFDKYKEKIGKIVSGSVVRVDNFENTYIEIDEIRAVLEFKNRIKGEEFKVGSIVKALLKNVRVDRKEGIIVELSRTSPKFLEELLKMAVPEIQDGDIIVHKIARIPGKRAKVVLSSESTRINPIGATIGAKGVRIQSVSRELKGENIDCIEYSPIREILLSRSLSPAKILGLKIDDESNKAIITVSSDEKAKTIGKEGINIRLASMIMELELELREQMSSNTDLEKPTESDEDSQDKDSKKDITLLESLFKK